MCEAVGFAGGTIAVHVDRALTVEVGRRSVVFQTLKGVLEFGASVQLHVRRSRRGVSGVGREMGVLREKCSLPCGFASVGVVGVGVDEFADRDPVAEFLRSAKNHGATFMCNG